METLINGNCYLCFEQIPDKSIDCIFTDVPYKQGFHCSGIGKNRPNYQKIRDYGSSTDLDYHDFFYLCLKKLKAVNFFTFCDKETKFEFIRLAKEKEYGYKELCFCKTHWHRNK